MSYRKYDQHQLTRTQLLVIVWFDGKPELWVCDGQEGFDACKKMYEDKHGADCVNHISFIHSFKEERSFRPNL